MSEKQLLHTSQIRTDGGTQMRAELDPATIEEYAQAIQAGATFPPIVAYYDGTDYWLGDGFHRLAAYKKIFMGGINCEVRSGTRRDAVLCAAGANATHGRRRTNADKRRSVETLLRDQEWGQWSDREIAKACCVDHKTVGNLRRELSGEFPQIQTERTVQRNGQTYTMQTANIATANQDRKQTDEKVDREISHLHRWLVERGWGINYAPMPNTCYVSQNGMKYAFRNRDDKNSELAALRNAKAHEESEQVDAKARLIQPDPTTATQPTTTYQAAVAPISHPSHPPVAEPADATIPEESHAHIIRRALVNTDDDCIRWQQLARHGATDEEIIDVLLQVAPHTGGNEGQHWIHYNTDPERRACSLTIYRHRSDTAPLSQISTLSTVVEARHAWGIEKRTSPLKPAETFQPRLLTDDEAIAVVWRAIKHNCITRSTQPASIARDRQLWLKRASFSTFRDIINPGVSLPDATLSRAIAIVFEELSQSMAITANRATDLIGATLSRTTFGPPIIPAKIKFIKSAPFAVFKSFLASDEIVTDETMIAAISQVEAALTRKMERCEHREIGPDNCCTICGQPQPITSQPADPADPIEEKIDGDEYYTPPYIIEAARQVLGEIDLDPASSALAQTVVKAKHYYTKEDDGLTKEWVGTVWHNPPYSRPAPFVAKLIAEYEAGNITAAILLVNTGTETQWGQSLLTRYPVCFVGAHGERRSRISFWRDDPTQPDNRNRYSQMIFYLGNQPEQFVSVFQQFGAILDADRNQWQSYQ